MATIPASEVVKGQVVRFRPLGNQTMMVFNVTDVGVLDDRWAKFYGYRSKLGDDGYGDKIWVGYGNRMMYLVKLDGECEVMHTWPKTAAAKWPDRIEDDKGFVVVDAVTGKGLGWFASMAEAEVAKVEAGVANVYRSDEYRQGWVGRHFGSKTSALQVANAWNGEFEDGEVDRPGFAHQLDYVIQRDSSGFVWMTMSHLSMAPVANGVADTLDSARSEVEASVGKTAASQQDIGFNMRKFFYWGTTDIGLAQAKRTGEIRDGNDRFVIVSTSFEDVRDSPVAATIALPVTWLWDNIDPNVREMCPDQKEFFRIMGRWFGELNVVAPIPARYLKTMG